jgi:Anti-sigma factor NepR
VPGKHKAQFENAASTREIRQVIGQQLKADYDLAERIPDRLAELLEQLAQRMNERERETE